MAENTIRQISIPDSVPFEIEAPYVEINSTNKVNNGGVYILDENGQASYGFEKNNGFIVSNREGINKFGDDNLYIKTFNLETGTLK